MKILVAVVVLTALALIGSRREPATRSLPFNLHMVFTGSEYIVIRLLLGGDFLNLIDASALDRLRPFVAVILGWIGFLFGLQFDRRTVSRLPGGFLSISAVQGIVTILAVAPVAWYLLEGTPGSSSVTLAMATTTLAAAAACTGQTAVAIVDRRSATRARHLMTLLRFTSSLNPAVGVIAFGAGLSFLAAHPFAPGRFPLTLQWFLASVCLGFLTAWIFTSLTVTRTSQAELVLYLLGTVALASGVALGFNLSALFVSTVCGLVVANLTHVGSIRGRLMDLLIRGERFLYLVLLVLAGASWQLPGVWLVAAAIAYIVARTAGKVAGGYLATRSLRRHHAVPALVGLGLTSQGGMALAIVIGYQLVANGPLVPVVMSIAVVAIIVNELVAPWLITRIADHAEEDAP